MASKISKYFLSTSGANFSTFDLDYAQINLTDSVINFKGNAGVDNVYVGNGFNFDFTNSLGSIDRIYLKGASSDYNYSYDANTSALTLTHKTVANTVILIPSADTLVFTDGSITGQTISTNLPALCSFSSM